MERIYRFYNNPKTATTSILEVKDIDVATGNVKGRDLYTGKMIIVNRNNMRDRAYFTEQEIKRRFPNYPLI